MDGSLLSTKMEHFENIEVSNVIDLSTVDTPVNYQADWNFLKEQSKKFADEVFPVASWNYIRAAEYLIPSGDIKGAQARIDEGNLNISDDNHDMQGFFLAFSHMIFMFMCGKEIVANLSEGSLGISFRKRSYIRRAFFGSLGSILIFFLKVFS